MSQSTVESSRFRRTFLLALVTVVSGLFLWMISGFLMPLLLAAIACGIVSPLYRWLLRKTGGRETLASLISIVLVLVLIVGPLMGLAGIVTSQALRVSAAVRPQIEKAAGTTISLMEYVPDWLPFREELASHQGKIAEAIRTGAAKAGAFLFSKLSAMAKGTAGFFFDLCIMLYAMFVFFVHGSALLERIKYYIPLPDRDTDLLFRMFTSVSRATLKGTLIIGIIQGVLGGIGLAVAGIQGAAFWGTLMAVLSIVPGIGIFLVWGPAAIYLIAVGKVGSGVALAVYSGAFVGTIDNFLRPRLVGKEAKLPDLMILLGTFGGLVLFGAPGLVIGPMIAALFVTVWEFYGRTFKDALVETQPAGGG